MHSTYVKHKPVLYTRSIDSPPMILMQTKCTLAYKTAEVAKINEKPCNDKLLCKNFSDYATAFPGENVVTNKINGYR